MFCFSRNQLETGWTAAKQRLFEIYENIESRSFQEIYWSIIEFSSADAEWFSRNSVTNPLAVAFHKLHRLEPSLRPRWLSRVMFATDMLVAKGYRLNGET